MIFYIIATIILLAVLFFVFRHLYSNNERPFLEAIELYRQGSYDAALTRFDMLLYDDPYRAIYHWYAALINQKKHLYTHAMTHYENILRINNYSITHDNLPDLDEYQSETIYQRLVDIYTSLHLNEKLINIYTTLSKQEPENSKYPFAIANLLIAEGLFNEETLQYLKQTVSLDPRNDQAYFLISIVHYMQDDIEQAFLAAEKARSINPGNNDASFLMGLKRYKDNLRDEAREFLSAGLRSKHFKRSASYYTAKLLAWERKREEAISHANDAMKAQPSSYEPAELEIEIKYLLGELFEEEGIFSEAANAYAFVHSINPAYRDVEKKVNELSRFIMSINIDRLESMRIDDLMTFLEKFLAHSNYRVSSMQHTDDKSVNIIAEQAPDQIKTVLFCKRGAKLINTYMIEQLSTFMDGNRAAKGIYITTGDFSPESKAKASENDIELINGDQIIATAHKYGIK